MSIAYLGIGGNIGDRGASCEEAVSRLRSAEEIEVLRYSEFYLTEPVSGPPQEDYLNGVLKIKTGIFPEKLLSILKGIENDMGRRPAGRNHPRIIDIDILLYDSVVMRTDNLTIPHPRMHERYFVLRGLAEIAPDVVHPALGKTITELFKRLCSLSQASTI
ncbi:MAG: 2-amino-4-hydroxy-6-hydroxymethyldihydropteridine diphosphokinase [Candidatus Makaraimicrobium thalassicum]|nr:MAG: 2-amino-4-hydroxy-6-hydroxymethyldihydropteridine diphosphokinase [Candidatus Omnitrophota bacterium]